MVSLQKKDLKNMVTRPTYLAKITAGFKHVPIIVLIGARQVGKTSLMNDFAKSVHPLFLNGQNPEIAALFTKFSTIEQYLQTYLNPQLDGYLLLDEFQFIEGVSTMMKLLTDKYDKLRILCSGSSSLNILQEVEESLAGRVRMIEVLSLSFSEILLFKDKKLEKLYRSLDETTESSALTGEIEAVLSEYLVYGGLPRMAVANSSNDKVEILDDIYQTYLLKDVRQYVKNEHVVGFNRVLKLLAAQIGNLVNVNELSRESGLPYKACEEYLYLLEQMYIIKMIAPYAANKRKTVNKMKKVYFCDLGLRNRIDENFNEISYRADNGALFENFVLLELWRNKGTGGSINFFRTLDGTEVDFVVKTMKEKIAVEAKFKTFVKPTNLLGFNRFCDDENIERRYLVNKNLNEQHGKTKFIQGFLVPKIEGGFLFQK